MNRQRTRDPGERSRPGSLSAPGALTDAPTEPLAAYRPPKGSQPGESLAEMAVRYGLRPSAARPPFVEYLRRLWQRRHFIVGFATARNVAMYTEARLGQVWQVLTPLLNVAVYFLIFGVILGTKRGIHNYVAFLVIGVFVFNFTQRSFIISSRVMFDSLPLIRALYFPRACLPLGYVLIELQQLAISFVILFAIVLVSGEPLTWYWLLIIPILVMQTLFNVGAAFILARVGSGFDDVSQLLPFIVRTWFYASGVMFSILTFSNLRGHLALSRLLQLNPAAIYITLTRNALMQSQRLSMPGSKPSNAVACNMFYKPPPHALPTNYLNSAHCPEVVSPLGLWIAGAAWAVVILIIGFIFFWRAEVRYGRG
jgi:teichoic acid transport system permease protein